ncbi:hypothetical protein I634_14145 [Alteromonas mediterranea U8]|nr:hypothetical protein I634_14145 [Alteromonas mediterranea U8]
MHRADMLIATSFTGICRFGAFEISATSFTGDMPFSAPSKYATSFYWRYAVFGANEISATREDANKSLM